MGIEWKPVEQLGDDLKDGRQLLFWQQGYGAVLAAWCDERNGFWDTGFASEIDGEPIAVEMSGVTRYAVVNDPHAEVAS